MHFTPILSLAVPWTDLEYLHYNAQSNHNYALPKKKKGGDCDYRLPQKLKIDPNKLSLE